LTDPGHIDELKKKRERLAYLEWAIANPEERAECAQSKQWLEQKYRTTAERADLDEPLKEWSTAALTAVYLYRPLNPDQHAAVCEELAERVNLIPLDHPLRDVLVRMTGGKT
jgi:hypothetical protein